MNLLDAEKNTDGKLREILKTFEEKFGKGALTIGLPVSIEDMFAWYHHFKLMHGQDSDYYRKILLLGLMEDVRLFTMSTLGINSNSYSKAYSDRTKDEIYHMIGNNIAEEERTKLNLVYLDGIICTNKITCPTNKFLVERFNFNLIRYLLEQKINYTSSDLHAYLFAKKFGSVVKIKNGVLKYGNKIDNKFHWAEYGDARMVPQIVLYDTFNNSSGEPVQIDEDPNEDDFSKQLNLGKFDEFEKKMTLEEQQFCMIVLS